MAVAVFFQIVQKILPIQNKGLPLLSIKHRKSMLKGFQHIQRRSSFGFFYLLRSLRTDWKTEIIPINNYGLHDSRGLR